MFEAFLTVLVGIALLAWVAFLPDRATPAASRPSDAAH